MPVDKKDNAESEQSKETRAAEIMRKLDREDLFALYSVFTNRRDMVEALCRLEEPGARATYKNRVN